MDIQAKKLRFIEQIIRINDEKLMNKLIELLLVETSQMKEKEPKPFSMKEFNDLIDRSESDSQHGREISAHDLKKEIDSWG